MKTGENSFERDTTPVRSSNIQVYKDSMNGASSTKKLIHLKQAGPSDPKSKSLVKSLSS